MPVKGTLNFAGMEDYLPAVQQAGYDIDVAAAEAVASASPILEQEMQRLANENRLTGATVAAISMSGVTSEGSFHYVEVGAATGGDSAAQYNEFGTVHMEAQPFIRPVFRGSANRWRTAVKAYLRTRMGVDFK